jgi:hypothetical protein
LCPRHFLAQPLFQLFDVGEQSVVLGLHERQVVFLVQLEFGFELGEIDFLGIALLQRVSPCWRPRLAGPEGCSAHTFSCSALDTRLASIPLMLSSTTSASTVMTPSACVRVKP